VYSPPDFDEIEVSFWGPGYGECILIHALNNEWIIIDSCIDPITKRQPALEYLKKISVNPAEAVKLIAATHWHDDHIRGLSGLFDICKSADFLMSEALTKKEFLVLAESIGKNAKIEGKSGLEEMQNIFSILEEASKSRSERNFKAPIRASANKCVWVSPTNSTTRLFSLSPSDYSILQSERELAGLIPKIKNPKNWLVTKIPNANHVAVVLWFEFSEITLLLGSDLEDDKNPQTGWTAIVNSSCRQQGKAAIYKIPHHGSITGHNPDVWGGMLTATPYAVCSPYNRGNKLPSPADVHRLCGCTPHAYVTSTKKISEASLKKEKAIQKTIEESGIKFHEREYLPGMVRLRKKLGAKGDACSLETFHSAAHLSNFR